MICHNKKALLLDMNNTFMFGEDRFGESEDFSLYYHSIGGKLPKLVVNTLISNVVEYLNARYPIEEYRNNFPSVAYAIEQVATFRLPVGEIQKIIDTFSYHEHGFIPKEYINVLFKLREMFLLAVVIDIWSPKKRWEETFKELGIDKLFAAYSFSSDHGIVKPSPKPFEMVVNELGLPKKHCLIVGDSPRRDLGGAIASGIDCVLVGGAENNQAVFCYENLLAFYEKVIKT